ncbi:hypothetical protein SLEP1_g32831 [Rubroshorea leprosula]|uniref:Uncharacterized protein n=1 Tax=Rubroshorea leprosula TaxID=152421 RepID=A0AAV5KEN8_9ROSI|nr:hypothetical protein SLEP1_g32831 [Rubroshorea leprosula]
MDSSTLAAETQLGFRQEQEDDEGSFSHAMHLAMGIVLPMAMQAAVELGVLDIIARAGPGAKLSTSEIASQMPTSKNRDVPLVLDRLLRLLTSHRVLVSSINGGERFYGLASVAKYFVPDEDGVSLGPFLALLNDKVYMQSWPELKSVVLEGGIPFNKIYGMHIFEYLKVDPRFGQVFNKAMIKPHNHCHEEDLGGVEQVGGDMFESIPQGEVIFMKWTIHYWADEECLRLLKNCHQPIPKNGKVIVMDAVLTVEADASTAAKDTCHMDVALMAQNYKGKERTQEEFMALATGAEFSGIRFECLVCNFSVMEFYK